MKTKEILFFTVLLFVFSGCISQDNVIVVSQTNEATTSTTIQNTTSSNLVDRIEIYHFHGTNQCYSCKTVGAYAEETVNTYFADELKTGKIAFAHINYDLLENKDLAEKYGVTGSSLWIGTYKGDVFSAEQNTNVWYKINDKEDYMNYLKGVIESKLASG